MPRLRFSSTPDSQTDPFNADDPVMPGEGPEWLDDESMDEPAYAPHGDEDGVPHKDSDNYRAPTTHDYDYDAPSIDEPAASGAAQTLGRQWQRARDAAHAQTRTGKRWVSLIVAAFVVLAFLGTLGDLLAGCVSHVFETVSNGAGTVLDVGEPFDDYVSHEDDTDWRETAGELDLAAGDAVEQQLGALLADPSSGELHDLVAAYLDEKLTDWEGYTAAELGIDADAWAAWVLGGVSYQVSSVYAYDDTGSAFLDVESCRISDMVREADVDLSSYLHDRGLRVQEGEEPAQLSEEQRAEVAELWSDACEEAASPRDMFVSVELSLVDGVWTIDEESLEETFESVLALY